MVWASRLHIPTFMVQPRGGCHNDPLRPRNRSKLIQKDEKDHSFGRLREVPRHHKLFSRRTMNLSLPAVLVNGFLNRAGNGHSSFKSETAVRNSGYFKGEVL